MNRTPGRPPARRGRWMPLVAVAALTFACTHAFDRLSSRSGDDRRHLTQPQPGGSWTGPAGGVDGGSGKVLLDGDAAQTSLRGSDGGNAAAGGAREGEAGGQKAPISTAAAAAQGGGSPQNAAAAPGSHISTDSSGGGGGNALSGDEGQPMPEVDLATCMAEAADGAGTFMTTEMYLARAPTRLDLDLLRLSPQRAPKADITMVVTYDVSRLHMLEGLCLSWGGPISAAVYQTVDDAPLVEHLKSEPLRDARHRIKDLFHRVSSQRACMLDVMLFSEAVSHSDARMTNFFPVNSLRNRAMLLAQTDLVLVIDGDLLSQNTARAKLAGGTARGDALRAAAARKAYHVLPSFDTRQTELAYDIAAGDKVAAVAAFDAKDIVRFGAKNSRFPQGCTDYDRWRTAAEQYQVTYCNRYEPWGIVAREHTPWFDSRFRGYGRNKIMYAAALNSSGFSFVIDPDTFVIHRPHTKSASQRLFDDDQDKRIHEHIMGMWEEQKAAGVFAPVVDATSLHCRAQLPWWAGVGSLPAVEAAVAAAGGAAGPSGSAGDAAGVGASGPAGTGPESAAKAAALQQPNAGVAAGAGASAAADSAAAAAAQQ